MVTTQSCDRGDEQPWTTAVSTTRSSQSPGSFELQWSLVVTRLPGINAAEATDAGQEFKLLDSEQEGMSLRESQNKWKLHYPWIMHLQLRSQATLILVIWLAGSLSS